MRRSLLLGLGLAALAGAVGVAALRRGHAPPEVPPPMPSDSAALALSHAEPAPHAPEPEPEAVRGVPGLDLLHVTLTDGCASAPSSAGIARLSLRPSLQREALALMEAHHLPEAALVLMDVATGKVLVYASRVDKGPARDLCVEASAPSASVFKIVTAAALVEDAHLGPDTKQCYSGGEQRITALDLVDDPQRDRWCTTLAGALGRSINTVFARLARARLTPAQLEAMAARFGYGDAFAFDVPVQPGALHIPSDPLDFARTAAGFWNTTLSPLQAATMSAIVAGQGEAPHPSIVDDVVDPSGAIAWTAPEPRAHRAIPRDTAEQVEEMMEHTVNEGTSYRAFHDGRGVAYLPGIQVAGKTGTLTEGETQRFYTWFTGFAPARPDPATRQVAVAALVVNGPTWQIKANTLARDLLRAYFAEEEVPGVSRPSVREVARHHKK